MESPRRARQIRRRQQERRRQITTIGVIAVVVIGVLGVLYLLASAQNQAASSSLPPISAITPEPVPANANGKTLGPANAPVTVVEFSDFQ